MITPIGDWVLRRACTDASHLPGDCVVAVNISPVQFGSRDFVQRVRQIVSETGIDLARLETRSDRNRHDAGSPACGCDSLRTGRHGHFRRGRRFRDRLFQSELSHRFPLQEAQDRPINSSRVWRPTTVRAPWCPPLSASPGHWVFAPSPRVSKPKGQATLLRAAGCDVVQGFLFGKASAPGPRDDQVHQG